MVQIIDNVLQDDDLNGDGYVSFYEFMADRGNEDPNPAPDAANAEAVPAAPDAAHAEAPTN